MEAKSLTGQLYPSKMAITSYLWLQVVLPALSMHHYGAYVSIRALQKCSRNLKE